MPFKNIEEKKEYYRKWREKNRESIIAKRKIYNSLESVKLYKYNYNRTPKALETRKKYNEKMGSFYRNARRERRDSCFIGLGGKCAKCGFSDFRALQVDHINGDGNVERHLLRRNDYYPNVLKSFLADEKRYQLLCCNCNWIKREENGEFRKKNGIMNH